jgi:hypothetical protein
MANITVPVNPGFPEIYQWDLDDDVIGGADGIATRPIQQLTERTAYLKKLFDDDRDERFADRVIGKYEYFACQPSPLELAKWRMLPLQYQIIEIALYQDLCDRKWVGSDANATADWWYRCDANGARNAGGLHMRVEDARGLFFRGAGANAVKKGANNAPYDGNAIGTYIGDASRDIKGARGLLTWDPPGSGIFSSAGVLVEGVVNTGVAGSVEIICIDISRVVPTANEFRPASISVLVCVSY